MDSEDPVSVYTVSRHAQCVPADVRAWGRGWVPNKAGSMDHIYGEDIQGGSIAISG